MSQVGQFISAATGGFVTTLTGSTGGGAIPPDGAGNITLVAGAGVTCIGAGNSITIAAGALGTTQHAVQVGDALGGIASIALGTTGTVLAGVTGADPAFTATPTVTTINATTFDTNVAAAGVTLSGTTLSADGTDADININITAKGAGTVIIDELTLTTDLAVTEGGTGVSTLTDHGVLLGSGAAAITATAVGATGELFVGATGADATWLTAGTANYVLTAHGAGNAVTWEANVASAIGTLSSDAGTATGTTVTIAGGTNITTSAAAATVTVNLDAAITGMTSITMGNAGSLQSDTTTGHTMLIQAYDVDGTTYVPFITLTNANDPTCDLNTGVTIGTKYIYRADGTDVPVTDGGTGASTLTDHGVLLGSGTGAITATAVGATGEIFVGSTGADATWLAAGDANKVLTAHGAGSAVTWETPASGGLTWSIITSDQSAAADNGYICNKAGVLTLTLPASCAVGKTIRVSGMNTSNGWKIAQNAGQTIYWDESNATTTGVGGYLQSADKYDAVEIVCSVADTSFIVVSSKGNITIA